MRAGYARLTGDGIAAAALTMVSSVMGYAVGTQLLWRGVFAEPIWLQIGVFCGFQLVIVLIVFSFLRKDVEGMCDYPKVHALFDRNLRVEILKMLLVFLACPIPYVLNMTVAERMHAVIEIEEYETVTIRGKKACRFHGEVQTHDGSIVIDSEQFPFRFTGDVSLCRDYEYSKDMRLAVPAIIYVGPMSFVENSPVS